MRTSGIPEPDRRDPDQWRYAAAVVILWTGILAVAFV